MGASVNYVRKSRGKRGENENVRIYKGRESCLLVRTRYIRTYYFYEIEVLWHNLNSFQLFIRLIQSDLLNQAQ